MTGFVTINFVIPVAIKKLLSSSDPAIRKSGWYAVWKDRGKPDLGRAIDELKTRAFGEADVEIGAFAFSVISGVIEAERHNREVGLQELLRDPFDPQRLRPSAGRKQPAVVAVTDRHFVRDAYPLITLAQLLPDSRNVKFHLIPFEGPDWDQIQISSLSSICLVGRPGMFGAFALSPVMPEDLRFAFPGDDHSWRGKPMTKDSIEAYHHLQQRWRGKVTKPYKPHEESDAVLKTKVRFDYGVVQRFPVEFGGDTHTVMILGGATSLGTAGAVAWATGNEFDGDRFRDYKSHIDDSTRIEVLLEVRAGIQKPRRPWVPRVKEEKLFINGSPNLIKRSPEKIVLMGGAAGPDNVRDIFFDDDGQFLDQEQSAALAAVCLAAHRHGPLVDVDKLIKNSSIWRGGHPIRPWADPGQALQYYRDNFQRKALKWCLHQKGKNLWLDTKVELT